MHLFTMIRRAFSANPRAIPVSDRENRTLEARGIQQPVIRSYLAWRRSVMIAVIIFTLLSAGLTTYRTFWESGEQLDVLQTMAEHFRLDELRALQPESDADITQAAEKANEEIEEEDEEEDPQSAFGRFTEAVELISLNILPLAALAVVALWTRFQLSARIMVAAFAFAFLVPLLIGLCPWSWWGYVEPTYNPQTHPLEYFKLQAEGLWEGLQYLVALLPTVLSLVPGVQRACIRVKFLLPQSILPGWFLVMASPFYALFLLVVFVAINQFHSHPLFFAGMLLFILAPLCYVAKADVFTKPLSSEEDYWRIFAVKRVVGAMIALAGLLLLAYLTTHEAFGVHLLGLHYKNSLLVPLDIVEFLLEILGRSMFVTVLGADLFMRMNLKAWKNSQNFAGSTEAAGYDRVMGELSQISSLRQSG
jgi:hypothetical protein